MGSRNLRDTCNHDQQPGHTCNRDNSHWSRRVITITTDNGTLQLTCSCITDQCHEPDGNVVNCQRDGTGDDQFTGLVTAVSSGTVTARATANDGRGFWDTCNHYQQPGNTCNRNYSHGSRRVINITTDNGTLQLTATVSPTNATNQTVTWSIVNGTGQATIKFDRTCDRSIERYCYSTCHCE